MVTTFEAPGERIIEVSRAESLSAASATLPQGAYTSLRTYGGHRVLRLAQHVRRLEDSVARLGALTSLDLARVRAAIAAALRQTGHPESRLRLTFAPPRLFVSVEPFVAPPESLYEHGARCVTVPLERTNPHSKDTRFIAAAAGAYRTLPPDVEEGILVARDGSLLEGLSSNVFVLLAGVLHTEEERALQGVTRSLVLELASGLVPIVRQAIRLDQVPDLGECFITSVSREVLPVVGIDEQVIGEGRPGPVTGEIRRRFRELALREAESVLG